MAVRFDAAADRLLITSSPLDYNANYTWMAWVSMNDINTVDGTLFTINNDGTSDDYLAVNTLGTTFLIDTYVEVAGSSGHTTGTTTLTAGTWYHIAAVRSSSTAWTIYLNGVSEIVNAKSIAGRVAGTRMESGGYGSANSSRFDGKIAAIKAWSTNLSVDQIIQEMQTIRPVEYGSLYGFWPTFPGSGERAADYGGLAHPWTEGGTLTDEDPPPVAWGAGVQMPPFTAGGTTYTDTGTGILTGIGSGDASNAYVDTGSATSIFVGSGADVATFADAGTGILIAVGSGADAPTYADSGTGVLTGIGSGADAPVYADSGTGILTGIGSGDDANAYVDTGSATSIFVGSGADVATLVDAGTGVLIAVGSGADAPTFADSGTAIMGLFGSGSAVAVLVDTGTGIMGLFGSGFDTGGQPIIRGCAALTQEAKPRAALIMQVKPIASIAQRPC